VRVARLRPTLANPALVIAAHGSRDPQFAQVIEAVASAVQLARPEIDVRIGYLDHGPPLLADIQTDGVVVVPMLLASGYHVRVDIPAQAPGAVVAAAIGPDPLVAVAVRDRLVEAGYDGSTAIVLAAAGSSDPAALADVGVAAAQLARVTGSTVTTAFVSAGEPRLAQLDVADAALATYLLAPGVFYNEIAACAAAVISKPIGDHPALAEVVLNRYDETCQHVSGS
jgi:sirohydrochlorin ferrochelatase